MKYFLAVVALGLTLGACSSDSKTDSATTTTVTKTDTVATVTPPPAPAPEPAPAAQPDSAAPAGFDPASAPEGQAPSGGFPYFSLMEGYTPGDPKSMSPSAHRPFVKKVDYDRYEFWDGTKLIPVEGRLYAAKAEGKGASWFQIKKTYEKLIKDLGGVTVFEGKSGRQMYDKKLKYEDPRQRATYPSYLEDDETGVYMVRTPDKQLWVEVDKPGNYAVDDYWLTVLETKPLEVKVKMLPAEEMKKALDKDGHVALYINFDTDKTAMKTESAPIIGEIVKLLTADPSLKLTVEGHTDNAGTPAHNQTLSEGRANAVVGALMAQGIALDRLQPKGFGQTKPLVPNDSEANKAKNRRVELVKR